MKQTNRDQPAKILIVDDEAQIIRVLKTALSTQGYSIRTSLNGLDGLIVFREWEPDVVITDLSMHEMSGIELCHQIRTTSTTPIIVLSVRDQEAVKVAALDAGADDYVTKPFSIQELQARVRAQLRRLTAAAPETQQITAVGAIMLPAPPHKALVR